MASRGRGQLGWGNKDLYLSCAYEIRLFKNALRLMIFIDINYPYGSTGK